MIEITMQVTPEQLVQIAAILGGNKTEAQRAIPSAPSAPISSAPAAPMPNATPAPIPTAPSASTMQQMFGAPLPTQTAPRAYTVQELGLAARPLVEMGRQQELMALLAEFGAPSVAELPESQRAAFAARLRTMGGQI